MPDDYELNLQEELWGCFKYIGISYDILWKMPIHQRKFIIMKHNMEQEGISAERKRKEMGENASTVNGVAINEFAKMEQRKQEAIKKQ